MILEKLIYNHCNDALNCVYWHSHRHWDYLEVKYKSQEVFSYLALVFEESFQTALLMSLSHSSVWTCWSMDWF